MRTEISEMNLLSMLLSVLWFFVPAYLANMAPVFASRFAWWEFLNTPVDFAYKYKGEFLFGSHKTWRGFAVGILWATFGVIFQYLMYEQRGFLYSISLIDYSAHSLLLLGFLFGFGALFGDLMKSFFKRRMKIGSGKKFIPFDQLDYTIGTLLFLSPVIFPGWAFVATALLLNFLLHILANGIGFVLKIKKVWW